MAETIVKTKVRDREGRKRFLACVLLFFLFSFLGWCLEKLFFYFSYGASVDRGFLTLPFCTVYGSSLLIVRAICGIPLKKSSPYPSNLLRLLAYAALSALIATAAELVTGLFFENVFHVRLWSYRGYAHEFAGYICLSMSIGWGFMIAAAMALFWAPLERILMKAPVSALGWGSAFLTVAISLDVVLTALSCL